MLIEDPSKKDFMGQVKSLFELDMGIKNTIYSKFQNRKTNSQFYRNMFYYYSSILFSISFSTILTLICFISIEFTKLKHH